MAKRKRALSAATKHLIARQLTSQRAWLQAMLALRGTNPRQRLCYSRVCSQAVQVAGLASRVSADGADGELDHLCGELQL